MIANDVGDKSLVMWFRQDVRRAVRAAWLKAFLFVFLAMGFLTPPLSSWESPPALIVAGWILGGASLVAGPIYLMIKLQRVLSPEIYIAVHRGGILWHRDDDHRFLAWEQIRGIRAREEAPGIVVATDDGAELVIDEEFIDVTSAQLAELLEELLQKALLGLPVKPRAWPR